MSSNTPASITFLQVGLLSIRIHLPRFPSVELYSSETTRNTYQSLPHPVREAPREQDAAFPIFLFCITRNAFKNARLRVGHRTYGFIFLCSSTLHRSGLALQYFYQFFLNICVFVLFYTYTYSINEIVSYINVLFLTIQRATTMNTIQIHLKSITKFIVGFLIITHFLYSTHAKLLLCI